MDQEVVKYPHSANLFQFCRRVLDQKYGGIRVIDQDVGQILGFDPADCSHWKKGKRNIRSIHAIKGIAGFLDVEEGLVRDLALGELTLEEALFEWNGYGPTELDPKEVEAAKKEYYRQGVSRSSEEEAAFKALFHIDFVAIEDRVALIHSKMQHQEPPLYLPEVVNFFPFLSEVVERERGEQPQGRTDLRYQKAKEMALHFLPKRSVTLPGFEKYAQHVEAIETTWFAFYLLAPSALVRRALSKVDLSRDLVGQLAEIFWVSKAFMNRRLKQLFQ